jgi:hypothetical protein
MGDTSCRMKALNYTPKPQTLKPETLNPTNPKP